MVTVYSYQVKAYAPDPRGSDNCFTYDGTVDRDHPLNTGKDFEQLLAGLADHVYAKKGVRIAANSITIQLIELLEEREQEKFTAESS